MTLRSEQRRWPRPVAVAGFLGCATLAVTLPVASAVGGLGVLGVGVIARAARQHRRWPVDVSVAPIEVGAEEPEDTRHVAAR